MNPQPSPQDSLVLSYLTLRKAVGIIGFALPFVLAIAGPGIQGSISCYYYTDMRNVLVGSLCAIGVFLMSTRGYDLRDEIAGRLACVFAIGVAFFPTSPCDGTKRGVIGYLHISLATLLFLTLAYFSIVAVQADCARQESDSSKTPEKHGLSCMRIYHPRLYSLDRCSLAANGQTQRRSVHANILV